ncbi:MAG: glutamine amidotransferase [Chitinivibrionales bacterium]|nr:glutamine amidotransferase [Chitinivibrionales bacterium]
MGAVPFPPIVYTCANRGGNVFYQSRHCKYPIPSGTGVKNLIVLKMGSCYPSIIEKYGDFDEMILRTMELTTKDALIIDVPRNGVFPHEDTVGGVIITGSHSFITDNEPWIEQTELWIRKLVRGESPPMLGICFGHHLLAQAFGGVIGFNPDGPEFGHTIINLHEAAHADRLFTGLPESFQGLQSHSQSVITLPAGAHLLASNDHDRHQAFRLGETTWGIQFHPEFDEEIAIEYIKNYSSELKNAGLDPEELIAACTNTPVSTGLLKHFRLILEQWQ